MFADILRVTVLTVGQDNFPAQPTSRHLEKSPPTRPPPFQISPPPVPTTPPKTQDRSTPIPYPIEDIVQHSMKAVLDIPKDEVQRKPWHYLLMLT